MAKKPFDSKTLDDAHAAYFLGGLKDLAQHYKYPKPQTDPRERPAKILAALYDGPAADADDVDFDLSLNPPAIPDIEGALASTHYAEQIRGLIEDVYSALQREPLLASRNALEKKLDELLPKPKPEFENATGSEPGLAVRVNSMRTEHNDTVELAKKEILLAFDEAAGWQKVDTRLVTKQKFLQEQANKLLNIEIPMTATYNLAEINTALDAIAGWIVTNSAVAAGRKTPQEPRRALVTEATLEEAFARLKERAAEYVITHGKAEPSGNKAQQQQIEVRMLMDKKLKDAADRYSLPVPSQKSR